MTRNGFLQMVRAALSELPPPIRARMANIAVFVRKNSTAAERRALGLGPEEELLGLYHGTPRTERGEGYIGVLPDRIILFEQPLRDAAANGADLREEIRRTVWHEVAHHFGLDDTELERLSEERGRQLGLDPGAAGLTR